MPRSVDHIRHYPKTIHCSKRPSTVEPICHTFLLNVIYFTIESPILTPNTSIVRIHRDKLHVRRFSKSHRFQNSSEEKEGNIFSTRLMIWQRYKGGEMTHLVQIHSASSNIKDEDVKQFRESLLYLMKSHLLGCPWTHPSCPAPQGLAHPAWAPIMFFSAGGGILVLHP